MLLLDKIINYTLWQCMDHQVIMEIHSAQMSYQRTVNETLSKYFFSSSNLFTLSIEFRKEMSEAVDMNKYFLIVFF